MRDIRVLTVGSVWGGLRPVAMSMVLLVLVSCGPGGTVGDPPCSEECPANAHCEAVGCVCDAGYALVGQVCTDIDECATDNGGCGDPTYTLCTNQVGAAALCTDIDECATDNGGCGDPTYILCTDQQGAAPLCTDIDECATDNGGCGDPTYILCTDQQGAAPLCTDVDECATDNGGCGDPTYTLCTDQQGAAPLCTDIDECATDNGGCGDPTYILCTNQVGAPPLCSGVGGNCLPPIWDFSNGPVVGTSADATDMFDSPCANFGGEEIAVTFVAPVAGEYIFNTAGSTFDTVLSVLEPGCNGAALVCNDDTAWYYSILLSRVTVTLAAQQAVVVAVGYYAGSFGGGTAVINLGSDYTGRDCYMNGDCNTHCPSETLTEADFPLLVNTVEEDNDFEYDDWSGWASDRAFQFAATRSGIHTFTMSEIHPGFTPDFILYAFESCGGTSLGCDDCDNAVSPVFDLDLDAGDQVLLVVDGLESGDFGEAYVHVGFACRPGGC